MFNVFACAGVPANQTKRQRALLMGRMGHTGVNATDCVRWSVLCVFVCLKQSNKQFIALW